MGSKRIQDTPELREFLAEVLATDSGGAYAVVGFVSLAEFVEAHPDLSWELGDQPRDRAYSCRLVSNPECELFRASNFGSISFWFWRTRAHPLAADSAFREAFIRALEGIETTSSELDRDELGFNLRFASFAGEAEFDILAAAIDRLVARCLASA